VSRRVELLRRARLDGELFARSAIPPSVTRAPASPALLRSWRTATGCWQQLAHEVFLRRNGRERGVVGLASATSGEGTSYVTGHLAVELARMSEQAILLLEANVYRPTQADRHGIEPEPGLRRLLAERELPLEEVLHQTGIENLWLLPTGHRALTTPEWTSFPPTLRRLRERFSAIVVDLPPVNLSSDVTILGAWLDGLVLVVEADTCSREVIQSAVERMRRASPNLLGAVLNKRKFVIPESIYRRL
jgi:Mrp family chromosome partitioning ATPase